ncbi:sarcosine oxidase subunit delta [Sulfitobacter guttiformis]|uniref:Sarcosine oxidase subunit delta n=1 Tax=Sulfitobacter guttiformis TaxID=74349 RepID=A0A420DJG4_9RHOB|nr:sarcosine oxidase subunit delta [Sulfitobacter guttiformis]KIN71838.1 Sarcosine oxidase, delta subunit, heterotetrameric [Sulfitobacter guttiformis KCTC 32187]RKE94348.1 sarcosine oxidase subunit delta [Sulfitobacter guttiformis]
MLIVSCPNCGITAEETEFHAHGEAHITRHAAGSTDDQMETYLFMRKNPKGVHFERWHHRYGCGKWFHMARDTMTLEVFGTYTGQTSAPPEELLQKIDAKRPGWRKAS